MGWGGGVDLKGHEILKSPGQGVTEVTEFRRLASKAIGEPEAASSPHLCHSLSTRGQAEGGRDRGDGRQERDLCIPRSPQAELGSASPPELPVTPVRKPGDLSAPWLPWCLGGGAG